jgi:hypothetical protein
MRTHNLFSSRLKKRISWIRWSNVSRCRKAMRTHFLHRGFRKKWLGRICVSNVLMALRIHNLHSGRLRKRLWWSWWSAVVEGPFEHIFSFYGHRKRRHGRSRLSDILIKRMALRTHNLPAGCLKKRICSSRWSDATYFPKVIRSHFLHSGH